MPWKFEYTDTFRTQVLALKHVYQKKQVSELLYQIKALEHPKNKGALYMNSWTYTFAGKSFLQCLIDEQKQIVRFTNLII